MVLLFLLVSCTSWESDKIIENNSTSTWNTIFVELTDEELSEQLKKDQGIIQEEDSKNEKELEMRVTQEDLELKKSLENELQKHILEDEAIEKLELLKIKKQIKLEEQEMLKILEAQALKDSSK